MKVISRQAVLAGFVLAAFPAVAQDQGGLRTRDAGGPRNDQAATLNQIEANRGCQMSATSVTVGVNKATGNRSSAQQKLATGANGNGNGNSTGCRSLVNTQVVTGVNLGLGRNSNAGQSVEATGQQGGLATTTFTRGANASVGAGSVANQRLSNQTTR